MFKFEKPKSQRAYKTEREYLKSVFYRNRKEIVAVFGHDKPMDKFIKNVQAQKIIGNLTTRQALNKLASSEAFTPVGERLQDNTWKSLKKFDKIKQFRELTKINGRYTAFDRSKLVWDRQSQVYVYDNRVIIDFTNSPQDVILQVI